MKLLIFILFLIVYCFQINAQTLELKEEEYLESPSILPTEKYEQLPQFPWQLSELRPDEILPNTQLSKGFYFITNQIDTLEFYYKGFSEGIDSSDFFVFTLKDKPHVNYRLAIKRENDWLCVEANTIKYLNLAYAEFEKIQIENDEFILITIATPEDKQVRSKNGNGTNSQLKQVRTVSLLNIKTAEYYLHNVMMGYIYNYNTKRMVDGEEIIHNQKAELQFDYLLDIQNGELKITNLKNYISSEILNENKDPIREKKEGVCKPIQKIGKYELQGNRFIFVE